MNVMLIIGLVMAVLSAIFWCIEATPFVKGVKSIEKPEEKERKRRMKWERSIKLISRKPKSFKRSTDNFMYFIEIFNQLPKLWPFAIDILITLFLISSLGLGGTIGSIIGITISNVLSCYLIIISRK